MFGKLSNYWLERDKKKMAVTRRRGWDWAAGALLEGRPIEEVKAYVQRAYELDHDGPFDEGASDAIVAWEGKLKTGKF